MDKLFTNDCPERINHIQKRIAGYISADEKSRNAFKCASKYCYSLVMEHTSHVTVFREPVPGSLFASTIYLLAKLNRLPKFNSITFKVYSYESLLPPVVVKYHTQLEALSLLDSEDDGSNDYCGDYLEQTDFLTKLTALKFLKVEPEPNQPILNKVAKLTRLVSLDIHASPDEFDDPKVNSLAPLSNHTNLQHLKLSAFTAVADISAITHFKRLRFLSIRFGKFTTVEPILQAKNLTRLSLNCLTSLSPEEVEKLAGLVNLQHLTLCSFGNELQLEDHVPELLNLAPFYRLTSLSLKNLHWNITGLLALTKLQSLKLRPVKKEMIPVLSRMTWLQSFDAETEDGRHFQWFRW